MTTVLSENLQKSLALSVACGFSKRSWAKRHDVAWETAYECSSQNEFRSLVDFARLQVSERMVGRLMRGTGCAIDQLVRLCRRGTSDAIRLSACRTLLTHWIPISRHFFVKRQIKDLQKTLAEIEKRQAAAEWRPSSPYKK